MRPEEMGENKAPDPMLAFRYIPQKGNSSLCSKN